jgi:hypothetical protein
MAIETLLDRGINARDFHPMVEKPKGKVEQKYEELKNSPFYNSESGQWMWKKGLDISTIDSQLLEILITNMFNKEDSRKKYADLKQTAFYDKEQNRWYWAREHKLLYSSHQLLGILVEGLFDKKKAKEQYQALKQTPLYDKEQEMWNFAEGDREDAAVKLSSNQLLEIHVEEMLNKQKAKNMYELKATQFYNHDSEEWNSGLGDPMQQPFETEPQLLGTAAEALFNKRKAKLTFAKLKENSFYNKNVDIWNSTYLEDDTPLSSNQLLGIWIEAMLEEEESAFAEKSVPLPEVRKF